MRSGQAAQNGEGAVECTAEAGAQKSAGTSHHTLEISNKDAMVALFDRVARFDSLILILSIHWQNKVFRGTVFVFYTTTTPQINR